MGLNACLGLHDQIESTSAALHGVHQDHGPVAITVGRRLMSLHPASGLRRGASLDLPAAQEPVGADTAAFGASVGAVVACMAC
jgi:hypothetical protein